MGIVEQCAEKKVLRHRLKEALMAKTLAAWLALAILVVFIGGCITEVRTPPPPPRTEVRPPAPHHEAVWIQGHWQHRHGEYVWEPGHWERAPRAGVAWVPGHWRDTPRGWVWTPGHWR